MNSGSQTSVLQDKTNQTVTAWNEGKRHSIYWYVLNLPWHTLAVVPVLQSCLIESNDYWHIIVFHLSITSTFITRCALLTFMRKGMFDSRLNWFARIFSKSLVKDSLLSSVVSSCRAEQFDIFSVPRYTLNKFWREKKHLLHFLTSFAKCFANKSPGKRGGMLRTEQHPPPQCQPTVPFAIPNSAGTCWASPHKVSLRKSNSTHASPFSYEHRD